MRKKLLSSLIRYILSLLLCIAVIIGIALWWAVGKTMPSRSELPVEQDSNAQPKEASGSITVATYNIGHGQGIKERSWDYRDEATTRAHLALLAEAMKKIDADIFLLQEVDLDSNRTHYINQIEYLKEQTHHPYYACAPVWEKNYIPFPYWPPAYHIGRVKSANCTLSRYPLSNHYRIIFSPPESNPFWYNWGYISRGIERVDVTVGDEKIAVLNLHLEAWDAEAREKQIKVTNDYMLSLHMPVILAGDFNTIIPGSGKTSGFTDEEATDYTNDHTFAWLFDNNKTLKRGNLGECLTPFDCYTFPSNNPDRLLDYIFLLGDKLQFTEYRVAKEAGTASDHLPVFARVKY